MVILPENIKIGNRNVQVAVKPLADKNIMGFYDPTNFRIAISSELSAGQLVETFWHELMHAIMDFTRFSVEVASEMESGGSPQEVAFNVEERSAESFAKTFLQVIQDNSLMNITTPQ